MKIYNLVLCMSMEMLPLFTFYSLDILIFERAHNYINDILNLILLIYDRNKYVNLQNFHAYIYWLLLYSRSWKRINRHKQGYQKMLVTRSLFRQHVIAFSIYKWTERPKLWLHSVNTFYLCTTETHFSMNWINNRNSDNKQTHGRFNNELDFIALYMF